MGQNRIDEILSGNNIRPLSRIEKLLVDRIAGIIDNPTDTPTDTPSNTLTFVTEGLVRHYDAINNTENGHDITATAWADLCGHSSITGVKKKVAVDSLDWTDNSLIFDQALSLQTDYIYGLNPDHSLTIEAYANTGAMGNLTDTLKLLSFISNSGFNLEARVTKDIGGCICDNGTYIVLSGGAVDLNADIHAVISFNPSTKLCKFYLNGVLKDQATVSNYLANERFVVIGGNANGNHCWDGSIYSVRIYEHELSADEVLQNYQYCKERFK